jgi:hypothetical protein
MTEFLLGNVLNLLGVASVATLIYVLANWRRLPVLQRLVGLQFFFVFLHIMEEQRFPGGFLEMLQAKLNFTATDPHFGDLVLSAAVVVMFVPALLFPRRTFLAMVPMVLGIFELVAHTAGIWMFDRTPPYTPGLATAAGLLFPAGAYSIYYAVTNRLMRPRDWLFVLLYMLFVVGVGQQIVIRSSGMSYFEFLANVRRSLFGR